MLTPTSQAYQDIQKCIPHLRKGIVVSIDPSIGSGSSQPGYAVYIAGELRESGILGIDPRETIPNRLQKLAYYIRKLYADWDADVLVYEDIPAQRHGGGNANSHASLLKAVGVVLSISGPDHYVGIMPTSWKRLVRPTYIKSDEADAIEIGWIAIAEAARIEEVLANKSRKKSSKRSK